MSPQTRDAVKAVARAFVITGSFIFIGLLAIGLFTAGGPQRLSSCYIGGGELEGWLWRYWWLKQVLDTVWSSPDLGFIERIRLSLHSSLFPEFGNVTDLWAVSMPLERMLGAPLYYNVKIILILTANSLGTYVMARGLGASRWAAWLAGVVFGFNPYFMFEIANGRVRQAIGFTCPLYVLFAWRTFSGGRTADTLAAALLWAMTTWIYLFYGMWLGFFNVLLVVWGGWNDRRLLFVVDRWRQALLLHVFTLLLVLPCLMPYFDALTRGQDLHEVTYFSDVPPLRDWVNLPPGRPAPGQELLYSMGRFVHTSLPADLVWTIDAPRAIPVAFTLLALVPLLWPIRTRSGALDVMCGLWMLVVTAFYLLCLGPYLKMGGVNDHFVASPSGVRLPYVLLFKWVPFFSRLFAPIRAAIMVYLALAALAALNLTRWTASRATTAPIAAMLLTALGLSQMWHSGALPLRSMRLDAPAYYAAMQMDAQDAIIELPFHAGDYTDFLQTVHGHKVLMSWADAGLPEGFPPGRVQWLAARQPLNENAFVRFLDDLTRAPETPHTFTEADLEMVRSARYRWVVLHERGTALFGPHEAATRYARMRSALEAVLGPPVMETHESDPAASVSDAVHRLQVSVFRLPRPLPASSKPP